MNEICSDAICFATTTIVFGDGTTKELQWRWQQSCCGSLRLQ